MKEINVYENIQGSTYFNDTGDRRGLLEKKHKKKEKIDKVDYVINVNIPWR